MFIQHAISAHVPGAALAIFCFASFAMQSTYAGNMPPPRICEHCDKPMLIQPGIDDLGLTLGQFIACLDKTRRMLLPADDKRLRRDIEWSTYGAEGTLRLPGETRDFYFSYALRVDHVLWTTVKTRGLRTSETDAKWGMAVNLASACR